MVLASTPAARAQSSLAGTEWESDLDCFIDEIDLHADGTMDISFGLYDEDDSGTWSLDGTRLTLTFNHYSDTFVGIYDGTTITAAHGWIAKGNIPKSETCTFTRWKE